jgi:hypothetical protein
VLEHAQLAQVAADRRLRDRVALALQQAHELLLAAHGCAAQQADDGGATRLAMVVGVHKVRA